jgi:hypothetical protein
VGVVTNENREERIEIEKNNGTNVEGKCNADDELDKVFNLHVLLLHSEIDEKMQSKTGEKVELSTSFERMMSDYLGVHL